MRTNGSNAAMTRLARMLIAALGLLVLGSGGPVPSGRAAKVQGALQGSNMTLLGRWDGRPTVGALYSYADIWGYTDPSTGREYALLAVAREGLSIIDITQPDSLVFEAAFFPSLQVGMDAKDVKVYDHYAILIKEHEPAQIIDLADPTQPDSVSIIHIGPADSSGGAHNAFVQGQYLYTMGDDGVGGLTIYDLTDPAAPLKVGEFQTRYYHDFHARGDTGYALAFHSGRIDILDLTNKSQPQLISYFGYAESVGVHNAWTSGDGKYLFVGDEKGTNKWTRVFDVGDPHNVIQVAEFIVDPLATVHNCYTRGDYLYLAHYTEGVRVVDVADPTNPVEVAWYDTYPAGGYGFSGGVWSVFPYFESGKIIISDLHTGLYVLAVDWVAVGVEDSPEPLPRAFKLAQNFPNPFNAATSFRYDLPRAGRVTLTIHDLAGRRIATPVDEHQVGGSHEVTWQAPDMASGVYIYRLRHHGRTAARKLVLLK